MAPVGGMVPVVQGDACRGCGCHSTRGVSIGGNSHSTWGGAVGGNSHSPGGGAVGGDRHSTREGDACRG